MNTALFLGMNFRAFKFDGNTKREECVVREHLKKEGSSIRIKKRAVLNNTALVGLYALFCFSARCKRWCFLRGVL